MNNNYIFAVGAAIVAFVGIELYAEKNKEPMKTFQKVEKYTIPKELNNSFDDINKNNLVLIKFKKKIEELNILIDNLDKNPENVSKQYSGLPNVKTKGKFLIRNVKLLFIKLSAKMKEENKIKASKELEKIITNARDTLEVLDDLEEDST